MDHIYVEFPNRNIEGRAGISNELIISHFVCSIRVYFDYV